jgi:hypothetical protein
MDREQFIKVLESCIESATGRRYPNIDWTRLSDRGLINCAEMVRDLLERRSRKAATSVGVEPSHVH